jgi:hypothetical protein
VASAVIIRLNTSSDMPMSMEMPASVRTSQNGLTGRMESTHSTAAIQAKPCNRPPAVSTRPMVEMPQVMSQNDQLPSLNDHNSRPNNRGQV